MTTRALHSPIPVISSSRPARLSGVVLASAQPGACPPPLTPQAVQHGAARGIAASCCPVASSSPAISSLIAPVSRRRVLIPDA